MAAFFLRCEFLIQTRGREYVSNIQDNHFHIGETVVSPIIFYHLAVVPGSAGDPLFSGQTGLQLDHDPAHTQIKSHYSVIDYGLILSFFPPGWISNAHSQRHQLRKR